MRFSAPVNKHWLGSFSPPSGLRGFVPVVRDRWEQGRPGGPGAGGGGEGGYHGGGGGVGARDPRAYIYIYNYICICIYIYIYTVCRRFEEIFRTPKTLFFLGAQSKTAAFKRDQPQDSQPLGSSISRVQFGPFFSRFSLGLHSFVWPGTGSATFF